MYATYPEEMQNFVANVEHARQQGMTDNDLVTHLQQANQKKLNLTAEQIMTSPERFFTPEYQSAISKLESLKMDPETKHQARQNFLGMVTMPTFNGKPNPNYGKDPNLLASAIRDNPQFQRSLIGEKPGDKGVMHNMLTSPDSAMSWLTENRKFAHLGPVRDIIDAAQGHKRTYITPEGEVKASGIGDSHSAYFLKNYGQMMSGATAMDIPRMLAGKANWADEAVQMMKKADALTKQANKISQGFGSLSPANSKKILELQKQAMELTKQANKKAGFIHQAMSKVPGGSKAWQKAVKGAPYLQLAFVGKGMVWPSDETMNTIKHWENQDLTAGNTASRALQAFWDPELQGASIKGVLEAEVDMISLLDNAESNWIT
jgi:hypothetical protein